MGIDQRRHPRFACDLPAVIQGPRGGIRGRVQNLSIEGAFFLGHPLPAGTSSTLRLELGAPGPIEIPVQIRHAGVEGMGLQFTRMEARHLERLQALLATLLPA